VKLGLLSTLNTERAARHACVLITDMADGSARLLQENEIAADPLYIQLGAALRTGKSGMVEVEGKRFFLTVQVPPVKLLITGAVHISQELAPMARQVGFDVVVLDPRTAFATTERFPDVRLLAEWPDDALPGLGVDRYTAFVALTHDPKIDDPALSHALRQECFYIGALGSRKTHGARVERLKAQGFSEAAIASIRAPVGLNIGAVSPAEIAVSILGEIIAALRVDRVAAKAQQGQVPA
jgi:xanthine dehydrogenase accessory factor